jgi:hypothetical protein
MELRIDKILVLLHFGLAFEWRAFGDYTRELLASSGGSDFPAPGLPAVGSAILDGQI